MSLADRSAAAARALIGRGARAAMLGLALLVALGAREARADGHEQPAFGGVGLVIVSDLQGRNDGLIYFLDGVASLPAGEAYEGWLVNSATGERVSTGVMAVTPEGVLRHVYRTPDGASIHEMGYDTLEITREPAPDDDDGPGETVYSHTHSEGFMNAVRHLLSHGLPPERAGERGPGDPDRPGALEALHDHLEEASVLADEAMAAEGLDAFRAAAGRLLALEEGILLEEAGVRAELLAGGHGPAIDLMAAIVGYLIDHAEARSLLARERVQAALDADGLEAGRAALDGAADALRSAQGAVVYAWKRAQVLAAFPVPEIPWAAYAGAAAPPSADPAAAAAAAGRNLFGGYGQVAVTTAIAGVGGLLYDIAGAVVPREGEAYEGWLANSATGERVSTGVMETGPGGAVAHIWETPDGRSILEHGYDTVAITLEPSPDPDPAPSREVFAYTHPEALWTEAQRLIGGVPGAPGEITALRGDLARAIGLVDAAMAAETIDGFREAVGGLLELTALLRREEIAIRAELLMGAHGPDIDLAAGLMDHYVASTEARTLRVRDQAQAALAADDLEAGRAALGGAADSLRSASGAIARSYEWAFRLIHFPVPSLPLAFGAPAALPVPAPPADGNAGLAAAGGGTDGARTAALLAAVGALAAAAALARRDAGRREAARRARRANAP